MTETLKNVIPPEHALQYILAGKATVGFHSLKTGNTFWFYVKRITDKPDTWYVYLGWNVAEEDKRAGVIRPTRNMSSEDGEPVTEVYYPPYPNKDHSPLKKEYIAAFSLVWNMLDTKKYHPQVLILHHGQCGYCGRPLTDATSLITGIGPVCRKRLGYDK